MGSSLKFAYYKKSTCPLPLEIKTDAKRVKLSISIFNTYKKSVWLHWENLQTCAHSPMSKSLIIEIRSGRGFVVANWSFNATSPPLPLTPPPHQSLHTTPLNTFSSLYGPTTPREINRLVKFQCWITKTFVFMVLFKFICFLQLVILFI